MSLDSAPLVVVEPVHERIDALIGRPAVIYPGDAYPHVNVEPRADGMLTAFVEHESGGIAAQSPPQSLQAGETYTVTWKETAERLGEYRIRIVYETEGRPPFEDTFYFTVVPAEPVSEGRSSIVRFNAEGRIVSLPDLRGNRIPDFSYVGYGAGAVPIPDVPVKAVVEPGPGDATERIQAAIDAVSALPLDEKGFRGAVLLKAGIYEISGTLMITTSGVVLRGEGWGSGLGESPLFEPLDPSLRNPEPPGSAEELRRKLAGQQATILLATGTEPADRVNYPDTLHPPMTPLIKVIGPNPPAELPETKRKITDWYVPVGARSFHVEYADDLKVGDKVFIYRHANHAWIHEIGMDRIPPTPEGVPRPQWEPPFTLVFDRIITAIDGNRITVDVPLTNAIEQKWGGGELVKYDDSGRISNIGVESMRAISVWAPNEDGVDDTRHVPRFLAFHRATHVWARNLWLEHFWATNGAITIGRSTKWATVQDVVSLVAPRRYYEGPGFRRNFSLATNLYIGRYGVRVEGQLAFIQRVHVSNGRHPFVFGSRVTGPNVFLHCKGYNTLANSEPHVHWSVGGLYDNVHDRIAIQDRLWYGGTSHGWSGANYVAWNTEGELILQEPPTAQNWSIGHVGPKLPGDHVQTKPELRDGYWESHGRHVEPESLYLQQLKDRLGDEAVENLGYCAVQMKVS